jgi:23S rRNA (uracil1939-C5)-methyltransferase
MGVHEPPPETPLRVRTRGMAYGPHAVGHHEGKVIFVRGGAPEEVLDVVLRETRARFAFADAVAVVEPSPARRQPPCPYLPRCGGCPWQHLVYADQLAAKYDVVQQHLRRIGGLDVVPAPIVASPAEWRYRQRLKLRVQQRQVGFYAAASHDLVAVDHCLLAAPRVEAALPAATALVRRLATIVQRLEIVAGDEAGELVLAAQAEGGWQPRDEDECRAWLDAHAQVRGLVVSGRGWRRAWGDERVTMRPEADLALQVHAGTFTQVNPGANRALVALVVARAGVAADMRVLDLYAGAGNLSLPLARRGAQVPAVEQHRQAADDGIANASRLTPGRCEFIARPARRAVAALHAAGRQFDLVVLDPPRSGAAEVLPALLRLAPARLVYVSCDPTSLARDLAQLTTRYRVTHVQSIDMFPHTYHVETVVAAELAC